MQNEFQQARSAIVLFSIVAIASGSLILRTPSSAKSPIPFYDVNIEILNAELDLLRKEPKSEVGSQISFNGLPAMPYKIHLKGNSTFQFVHGKPSLSCKSLTSKETDSTSRITKFYLHNNLQDLSMLRDITAKKVFRSLGIAVGNTAIANVTLNRRPLGLYTWVEGIDAEFLKRNFGTEFGTVIESEINSDTSDLIGKRSNKKFAKTYEPVPPKNSRLCIDDLRAMIAGDYLTGHDDGYSLGKNNYWIFYPDKADCWRMFPHTTDAAFRFRDSFVGSFPLATEAYRLLQDESQRGEVLKLVRIGASNKRFPMLIEETKNLGKQVVALSVKFEPDEAVRRCRAVCSHIKRIEDNYSELQSALKMEDGELTHTRTFSDPETWYVKMGNSDKNLLAESNGGVLSLERRSPTRQLLIESPIMLSAGTYTLHFQIKAEPRRMATDSLRPIVVGLANVGNITNFVGNAWACFERDFEIANDFSGKLFHLKSTHVQISTPNFDGRLLIDLKRSRIERKSSI